MERTWSSVRERDAAGAFGSRLGAQVPSVASDGALSAAATKSAARSWWARGARVLRNAAAAVAVMALVPIVLVAVRGDHFAAMMVSANSNTNARVAAKEPLRPFRDAMDPSITPTQAGAALNGLRFRQSAIPGFEPVLVVGRTERPWSATAITPDMFRTARPGGMYDGIPSEQGVLQAAKKGLTPREQEYLRVLAESPVWRDFDIVAHAPAVDAVGGQFRLPFGPDALPEQRPLPGFRDSKELAYASVSRAAYYVSIGQPRQAEQTLRSTISFGFAFIDNGSSVLEELIGAAIAGIGRDALQQLYVLEHDPRASLPALAPPPRVASNTVGTRRIESMPADEATRILLARLADPAVPRPERFETIRTLTMTQCTSLRGLMFGQRADVGEAIDRARTTLARYPSERALLELETRLPSSPILDPKTARFESPLVSAATVAGVVLHNPRMVACTRLLSSWW